MRLPADPFAADAPLVRVAPVPLRLEARRFLARIHLAHARDARDTAARYRTIAARVDEPALRRDLLADADAAIARRDDHLARARAWDPSLPSEALP